VQWGRRLGAEQGPQFTEPVAAAINVQHLHMMQQPIENRGGEDLIIGKDRRPIAHVLVRGQDDAAPFIARRHQAEAEIGLRPVQRPEADFIDDEECPILSERLIFLSPASDG